MIDKLLRIPLPEQLKALIEKLEEQQIDARSLRKIGEFLSELKLTRYERFVVGRVYKRARRLSDMDRIMNEIIIGEPEPNYHIGMDLQAKLHGAINSTTAAAMWNGAVPQPEQTKRVIARPKVNPAQQRQL
jgi:hypothetical protein